MHRCKLQVVARRHLWVNRKPKKGTYNQPGLTTAPAERLQKCNGKHSRVNRMPPKKKPQPAQASDKRANYRRALYKWLPLTGEQEAAKEEAPTSGPHEDGVGHHCGHGDQVPGNSIHEHLQQRNEVVSCRAQGGFELRAPLRTQRSGLR